MRVALGAAAALLIIPSLVSAPARAQLALPGAVAPEPVAPIAATPAKPRPPAPKRDVAGPARGAPDEAVIDRSLLQNGAHGRLDLEKRDGKLVATRFAVEGLSITKSGQACRVDLTAGGPVAATPLGRSSGLSRNEFDIPGCKIAFDVLDGAILVADPGGVCEFAKEDCRVRVEGMWGPPASQLAGQAKDIERARGQAEQTLRGNFKSLTQRASGREAVKLVAREQAAFTSERAMVCRDYDRENAHGFCNARYTQGRAAQLWARMGGKDDATASATPKPAQPRRAAPRQQATPAGPIPPRSSSTTLY